MGGSESKATVLECMIKNLKKGFGCYPTPVLLPGESHGRGSLVGCSPWGGGESDMTEATQQQQHGVKMKPNHLHILYDVEWPPMGVGWPPENTMNLKIVETVYSEESRDTWINIHILTHG